MILYYVTLYTQINLTSLYPHPRSLSFPKARIQNEEKKACRYMALKFAGPTVYTEGGCHGCLTRSHCTPSGEGWLSPKP